ncbi:30S ribosomal protein S19e [Candidatus Pacearchaeota archaeon]|nr:30S ribosomal protein S19e [Candidatus Pacearchaeota archaeon]|tara:strand:+ start:359 stop:940 length:582 start_codon:yes stop_codon:yes gene_type:complete
MAKVIFTKEPQEFVEKLAVALKEIPEFEKPEWVDYVKSGMAQERPPMDEDFWYVRAASILRQLYIKGVVGVGKLKTRYGARKNRGGRPSKFYKGGGKIIRVILQQAEKAELVEKMDRMQHGRRLTAKGRDFLDSIEVTEKQIDIEAMEGEKIEVKEVGKEEAKEKEEANEVEEIQELKQESEDGKQESEEPEQ